MNIEEIKGNLLTLDLQFFAEGEGGEGSNENEQSSGINPRGNTFNYTEPNEVPEYQGGIEPFDWEHKPHGNVVEEVNHTIDSSQQTSEQNQQEQSQSENNQTQQNNQGQNNQPEDTSLEFDFGGRKVKVNDPNSIKGAYEDFQNGQRTITQLQQQINQYEQFLQNLNSMGVLPNQSAQQGQQGQYNNYGAQQNTQQYGQQTNQQAPVPSKERMQELHDEYMNRMYDNKFEADQWWAEQPEVQAWEAQRMQRYVEPIVEPIQKERETNQRIQQMKSKYQDFDNFVPQMQAILDERPELNKVEQIENVYWMAKAQALESQPKPEQILQDPQFQQQILQNESIRNQILQNYQSQKQQQRTQAPPMMGNRPGGQSPTYQYKAPRSIREAGKLVRQNIRFN